MLCWIHEQSTGTNSVWWSSPDPSRIHCKKKSCIKFKRLVYFLFATIEQYFFPHVLSRMNMNYSSALEKLYQATLV